MWAFMSDDEHLCYGPFSSEEEVVTFINNNEWVLGFQSGRAVALNNPEETSSYDD